MSGACPGRSPDGRGAGAGSAPTGRAPPRVGGEEPAGALAPRSWAAGVVLRAPRRSPRPAMPPAGLRGAAPLAAIALLVLGAPLGKGRGPGARGRSRRAVPETLGEPAPRRPWGRLRPGVAGSAGGEGGGCWAWGRPQGPLRAEASGRRDQGGAPGSGSGAGRPLGTPVRAHSAGRRGLPVVPGPEWLLASGLQLRVLHLLLRDLLPAVLLPGPDLAHHREAAEALPGLQVGSGPSPPRPPPHS